MEGENVMGDGLNYDLILQIGVQDFISALPITLNVWKIVENYL